MPLTTDNAPRQLSDGNADGTCLGQSPADLIAFYSSTPATGTGTGNNFGATATGVVPIAQPSGSNQAAISGGVSGVGTAAGALTTYSSTQSPSSVATITTAEQSITVTGVLSTDMVIINKPTSQAGLGLCAGRVSAANTVKLVFANVSAGTLTPTASEVYLVTTIPANLQLSAVLTPAAVAANTVTEQTFTGITGLYPGQIIQVNKPTTQAGLAVLSARCAASNSLTVTYLNATAATITPTAGETYLITALNGLVAASQIIEFGLTITTPTTVTTLATIESTFTEAGIQATDVFVGASKPTTQSGLGMVGGRVSAASTVKIPFINATAGSLTPTAAEVYGVTIFRPSPQAPLSVLTSATLTPGSVAANTSAEQTFTVTGITSGQPVAVSPNYNISATNGVGIAGVRASALNTIAVTFINTTATAITPPSGTWTVAQFNQTTPTAGNYVQQLVSPLQTAAVTLTNAIRTALVNLGLLAGA